MSFVSLNIEYFPDPTRGVPVYKGYIYVGEPDTDPEVPGNQKEVMLRLIDGSTVPTSQPIRTGAGGVALYNNSPVQLLVDGDYSVKILDKHLATVYYVSYSSGVAGDPILGSGLLLSGLKTLEGPVDGTTVITSGRANYTDMGGGLWVFEGSDLSSLVSIDPLSCFYAAPDSDSTGASGAWVRQNVNVADPRWAGAVPGGDATTSITSLIAAGAKYIEFVYTPLGYTLAYDVIEIKVSDLVIDGACNIFTIASKASPVGNVFNGINDDQTDNVTFKNIHLKSINDQVRYDGLSGLSSNLLGFHLAKADGLVIENCSCVSIHAGIKIDGSPTRPVRNMIIRDYRGEDSQFPCVLSGVEGLAAYNLYLSQPVPAQATADHSLYILDYCKDLVFNDTYMSGGLQAAINFRTTGGLSSYPTNIVLNNTMAENITTFLIIVQGLNIHINGFNIDGLEQTGTEGYLLQVFAQDIGLECKNITLSGFSITNLKSTRLLTALNPDYPAKKVGKVVIKDGYIDGTAVTGIFVGLDANGFDSLLVENLEIFDPCAGGNLFSLCYSSSGALGHARFLNCLLNFATVECLDHLLRGSTTLGVIEIVGCTFINPLGTNIKYLFFGASLIGKECVYEKFLGPTYAAISPNSASNGLLDLSANRRFNGANVSESWGATAPIDGYWEKGAIIRAVSPTAGGYIGWVCTTAGTAYKEVWSGAGAYVIGDNVLGSNLVVYSAVADGGEAQDPTTDTANTYWALLSATDAIFKTYGGVTA